MSASDLELLEFAARAAEFVVIGRDIDTPALLLAGMTAWNPLRNHAQAKELRHTLCLTTGYDARFSQLGACAYATYPVGEFCCNSIMQNIAEAGGKKAALRRAIVRAAAEIGKAMP